VNDDMQPLVGCAWMLALYAGLLLLALLLLRLF